MMQEPEKYDILLVDGQTIPLLIEMKLIQEINIDIQKQNKYLPNLLHIKRYDFENKYSIPYLWGATTIAYNIEKVNDKEIDWKLFLNPKYKNKIALLDDPREVMTALLKMNNFSLNTTNKSHLNKAEENAYLLKKNKVELNETFTNVQKLINEEKYIVQIYDGDLHYVKPNSNKFKLVYPQTGYNIWITAFTISSSTSNYSLANKLIEFMGNNKNSYKSAVTFNYGSPITNVYNKLMKLKEKSFPDINIINNGEYIRIYNILKTNYEN